MSLPPNYSEKSSACRWQMPNRVECLTQFSHTESAIHGHGVRTVFTAKPIALKPALLASQSLPALTIHCRPVRGPRFIPN